MFRTELTGAADLSEPSDETLGRIEATQAALRDCIDQAKALASESERLIRRARAEATEAEPPSPKRARR
jgi:hypothetical protein